MENIALSWSGGKDAAMAMLELQNSNIYKIKYLLTTLSAPVNRISMHGIRNEILDLQAERMGLPVKKIYLPEETDMESYNAILQEATRELKNEQIFCHAFGDIFLEDLKTYRESQLQKESVEAIFPLWKKDTMEIIRQIEEKGIEAMIICVNERQLGKEFLGKIITRELVRQFPKEVDPCGENGEYHTLVLNAPFFSHKIEVEKGDIVHKYYASENEGWDKGYYFMDIKPLS